MASLRKFTGSSRFYCCYRDATGQRRQVSTKQTKRAEAQRVCNEWQKAADNARRGQLAEVASRRVISEIVEQVSGVPVHFFTVEGWLTEWVKSKQDTRSDATVERYRGVVRQFLRHLGDRAQRNIAVVTPGDIRGFRDGQRKEGKSPRSCNQDVKILSIAFNAAKRLGYIPHNPCEAVETLRFERSERSIFSQDQIRRLIAAAGDDWKTAVLLGYYTGQRLGDIANLRWGAVDLAERTMTFRQSKTSKTVIVPMHPAVEAHLLAARVPDDPRAPLCPSLVGRQAGGKTGLSSEFKRMMGLVGITPEPLAMAKGRGRTVASLSFHSLRHTHISAMANAGVAQELRQKLAGHSSAEINDIYTHHDLGVLRAAVEAIPDLQHS